MGYIHTLVLTREWIAMLPFLVTGSPPRVICSPCKLGLQMTLVGLPVTMSGCKGVQSPQKKHFCYIKGIKNENIYLVFWCTMRPLCDTLIPRSWIYLCLALQKVIFEVIISLEGFLGNIISILCVRTELGIIDALKLNHANVAVYFTCLPN